MKRLPCPHCGGNLYLDQALPGVFEVVCLACSRVIGIEFADDLAEQTGISRARIAWAERRQSVCLWTDEAA